MRRRIQTCKISGPLLRNPELELIQSKGLPVLASVHTEWLMTCYVRRVKENVEEPNKNIE